MGADIVVHSATKYLSGHADAMLGALVTADDQLYDVLKGRRDLVGAIPGTLEAWLALRGLRTLHLRVDRAESNARDLRRPPRRAPARSTRSATPASAGSSRSCSPAAPTRPTGSCGRRRCGCTPPRSAAWSRRSSAGAGGSPSRPPSRTALVRLSVGIEDVEDLWADLSRALDGLV